MKILRPPPPLYLYIVKIKNFHPFLTPSLTVDSDLMQGVKKIFGADDKKELVDPYFVFSFAGQEVNNMIAHLSPH